jgi:hypothetical protein
LESRKAGHISESIHEKNRPLYKKVASTGGWLNWKFDVLETGHTLTRNTAGNREAFFYTTLKPTLNAQPVMVHDDDTFEDWEIFAAKYGEDLIKIHRYYAYTQYRRALLAKQLETA